MLKATERLATGRETSLFEADFQDNRMELSARIDGARIAVIGAAGSIGFSVVRNLLRCRPGALTLIDLSENNLVEVTRALRSSSDLRPPDAFEALPIGLGSLECARFFRESPPFDDILNLSAMKHVRSEKNIYCLMRMIETNVLAPEEFINTLPYAPRRYFSVSSDKASNPANLMGASKRLMEMALGASGQDYSTARFANVAFSDGSLPYGFLKRLEMDQPLSAPRDVRRYFMSHDEAGQICVLSCMLGRRGDVFFPKLEQGLHEKRFDAIAVELLAMLGYEAVECASEDEARRRVPELKGQKKWPCWFFDSDTTGEKDCEEFYTSDETPDFSRFRSVGIVHHEPDADEAQRYRAFADFARRARQDPTLTKADYVEAMRQAVPGLRHEERSRHLDQKM